jgi:N-sulfoglucosamine sulfohydrolase
MRFLPFFLALLWMPSEARCAETRPNIFFAFADDWGRYASAYAKIDARPGVNAVIRTPVFDQVAKEGVLFRNAFVTAPSCTPCRSSLLSGQYFWRTGLGAILQGAEWDASIPTYPLLLRDAGFHIGQTYKVWSPGTPNDAPYGGRKYEYEAAGGRFNGFSQSVTAALGKGKSLERAKQQLYDEVLANFDAFMAARDEGKPFCYWFGPTNVHRKWVRGSGKALWGLDPDALKGRMPAFLPDVPEVREDFCDYLGEAMAFDTVTGLLLEKLKATGALDSTLVVISGDHGIPGFTRGKTNLYDFGTAVSLAMRWPGGGVKGGRVLDDFVNLMDLAPTFCEAGGVTPPAAMTGRSLLPILRSDKSGLVDPTRTWVVTGRERHVAAARDGSLPYPQRALRTEEFLYIRNFAPDRWPEGNPRNIADDSAPSHEKLVEDTMITFSDMDSGPMKAWLVENRLAEPVFYNYAFGKRPAEELYDLRADPDCLVNLASETAHEAKRAELADRLMGELRRTGDPRITGDGRTFDRPPFAPGK